MQDFFMRIVALPIHVEAVTLPNDDGTFDIYVNGCLSEKKRLQAFEHEKRHIMLGHFYDCKPVLFNEMEANGFTSPPGLSFPSTFCGSAPKRAVAQLGYRKKQAVSISELHEINRTALLKWEEKWLYDVG